MSKFPSLTPKKLLSFLQKQDFIIDHTTGSHKVLYRKSDKRRVVIPFHCKDLPKGTMFAILNEAGFSKKDYLRISKK